MPGEVSIAYLLVRAISDAKRAGLNVFRVGRPVVQMGRADLDVPADGVHHQRQHARVIDKIEKCLMARKGIADSERILRPKSLDLSHILCDFIDCRQ